MGLLWCREQDFMSVLFMNSLGSAWEHIHAFMQLLSQLQHHGTAFHSKYVRSSYFQLFSSHCTTDKAQTWSRRTISFFYNRQGILHCQWGDSCPLPKFPQRACGPFGAHQCAVVHWLKIVNAEYDQQMYFLTFLCHFPTTSLFLSVTTERERVFFPGNIRTKVMPSLSQEVFHT